MKVQLLILIYLNFLGLGLVNLNAQKKTIYNITILTKEGKPVRDALLLAHQSKDSNLIKIVNCDDKGKAVIVLDKLFEGYIQIQTDSFYTKRVYLPTTNRLDTIIVYKPNKNDEVLIKTTLPVTYRNDTLSFNDTYFKRDSLRTAEEIIKRFPGVIFLKDGGIEINGIKVSEILLDGQPIPANDIKTLMQTLQGSLLDKVQFIDRKSDEARLSGVNNGVLEKVLNIKLKAPKNKNLISNAIYIGAGNENKFEAKNNFNVIKKNLVLSSNVNYNNTGRSNYSNISYNNQNGINTGLNGNITLRYAKNKKLVINNTLNFGNIKNNIIETRERILYFTDSVNYYTQNLKQSTNNNIAGLVGGIYIKPTALQEYRLTYNANYIDNSNERNEKITSYFSNYEIINDGGRNRKGNFKNIITKLNWLSSNTSKNNKFVLFTTAGITKGNPTDIIKQKNNIKFFRLGSIIFDTLNQTINTVINNINLKGNISLTYSPIKQIKFHIGASINNLDNPLNRNALQYNYVTNQFDIINTTLTNNIENNINTFSQNAGVQFNFNKHNFNLSVVNNTQKNTNKNLTTNTNFYIQNKFLLPTFNYNNTGKKANINITSNYNQRAPTSLELQPIIDNTNPLIILKGNPNLKNDETFSNSFNINSKPNIKNTTYNINGSAVFNNNRIASNTIYDPLTGVQTILPQNLPSNYLATLNITVGKFEIIKKLSISAGFNTAIRKDNNFFNSNINEQHSYNINPKMGFKWDNKSYYININMGYLYQNNTFSLRQSQNLIIKTFTNDIAVNIIAIKNVEINLDYDQFINNNRGKIRRVDNVNTSVLYHFGKKKNLSIIASAFDLFNQNSNIRQVITNFYEDLIITNAVRKYYLLSFSYRFVGELKN